MKFLITGITGFVGPHLAKLLLEEGHTVVALIRGSNGRQMDLLDILTAEEIDKIEWEFGDLCDLDSLITIFTKHQFDGVFHLGAQSHPPTSFKNPILTFNNNVMGSVNLMNCVERYQSENCIFHFCSTSEVYGDTCKEVGILKETTPLSPCNPYGVSKASIDLYMQERIKNKKLNGFITRGFSHTGPRRGFNFSISSDAFQIAKMIKKLQKKTLLIGNLKSKRVVIDVRDCVRAYYLLMIGKASGVFNVCGSEVHEMQYFTDVLLDCSGLTGVVQKVHEPFYRPIDIDIQIGDSSRLRAFTKWEPIYPIETTLNDLLKYWVKKL